jgi:O-antigen/teichoic acid export membrane protein
MPLMLGQLSSWSIEKVNRLLLADSCDFSKVGLLGIGYQFGMVVLVIQSAISRTWLPYVIDKINNSKQHDIFIMIVRLSLVLFLITLLVSIVSYYYIDLFIDKRFNHAKYIVPFISLGYFIDGVWKLFNSLLIIEKYYKIYSAIMVFCGFVSVIVNYFLIKKYGLYGAALSSPVTFFCGLILTIYFVRFRLNLLKHVK